MAKSKKPETKLANNKMKLFLKMQQARCMFQNKPRRKSGKNTFQTFEYFELKDIVPDVNEIFLELKLYSQFRFYDGDKAQLKIIDVETAEYTLFEIPVPSHGGKNSNQQIQDIGKLTTYARRYLYLIALDIVEIDEIDKNSGEKKKPVKKMSVDEVNKHMMSNLADPKDMDEAKKELNQLKKDNRITQKVYDTVHDNIKKVVEKDKNE